MSVVLLGIIAGSFKVTLYKFIDFGGEVQEIWGHGAGEP